MPTNVSSLDVYTITLTPDIGLPCESLKTPLIDPLTSSAAAAPAVPRRANTTATAATPVRRAKTPLMLSIPGFCRRSVGGWCARRRRRVTDRWRNAIDAGHRRGGGGHNGHTSSTQL